MLNKEVLFKQAHVGPAHAAPEVFEVAFLVNLGVFVIKIEHTLRARWRAIEKRLAGGKCERQCVTECALASSRFAYERDKVRPWQEVRDEPILWLALWREQNVGDAAGGQPKG